MTPTLTLASRPVGENDRVQPYVTFQARGRPRDRCKMVGRDRASLLGRDQEAQGVRLQFPGNPRRESVTQGPQLPSKKMAS